MMSTVVKFSYDQYQEMIRLGLFNPPEDHRVELIFGQIIPKYGSDAMSPINPPHEDAVDELTLWSFEVVPPGAIRLRVLNSIGVRALQSQPEPDLSWLVPGRYARERPGPERVLLLIEVSDTTLSKDRGVKSRLYARAGIQDYWIINIPGRCIEVRRDPVGSKYQDVSVFDPGQEIRPLAFPDVVLPVARIFPD
jgi:Uma2 family endonuclease